MRALFIALAALTAASLAQAAESGSERGQALFDKVGCWECHGYSGQGGIGPMSGPRIARTVLPQEVFIALLRRPISVMPPFGPALLTEQQVADIYAFLQSRPQSRPASEIPLLRGAAP
jgi:mono/diheme cytochrome c family protein